MNTKTKIQEKAEKYYSELRSLATKITKNDKVAMADFERLEKLFKIAGIDEFNIKSIYDGCGFGSWSEYLSEKKCTSDRKSGAVSCVDDQIWIAVRNIELATRSEVYC
jgi:hypothetical protein